MSELRSRPPGRGSCLTLAISLAPLLLLAACAPHATLAGVPEHVRAAEAGGPVPRSPADAPEDWLLAFIDIETTGLVPGYHEPVDIGVVLTDLDGVVIDSLFLRIHPVHPERLSPGAARVNAFDPERWRELGGVTPAVAVDSLTSFHDRVAAGRSVLLVAFNSPFDAGFLDHLFRAQGRSWRALYHYFVLDVPSMAWSLGLRALQGSALAARLGVEDEPRVATEHTGLTGAQLNVRIYRALLEAVSGGTGGWRVLPPSSQRSRKMRCHEPLRARPTASNHMSLTP